MSRIGKLPIHIPQGVTVAVSPDNTVTVKGPKGQLSQQVSADLTVTVLSGLTATVTPCGI